MATRLRSASYWFSVAATWLILSGLYLLFTSNLQKAEVFTGLVAAAIATVGSAVCQSLGLIAFRPRWRDLSQFWRVPWAILHDTGLVLLAIPIQLFARGGAPSVVLALPFDTGDDSPPACARRALALLYITMSPGTVAMGIVHEQRLLLIHQIFPEPVTELERKLGVRA
jgi:multisubunit Na+/H+ antiporter MnhE subunit